jgi:uncharacterized protein (DUF2062 family)
MEIPKLLGTVRDKFLVPFRLIPEGGIPPDKMAFSITLGVVTGVFPVLGATTAISLLLTMLFRQNVLVVQSVQWIMAMLQVILIVPFMQLGALILKARSVDISLHQINISFQHGFFTGIKTVGVLHLYAIFTWTLLSIPAAFILYYTFRAVFRKKKS